MENLSGEELMDKIHPSRDFWESHLEMPIERLARDYRDSDVRKHWLDSLSGRQLNTLFSLCAPEGDSHDLPMQQKRAMLFDTPERLVNYFLVHHFNHAKFETSIVEVAKPILSADIMTELLVKDDKYDKKSLLFALFKLDPDLLKRVYHFDKVQKKAFDSFALRNPPRQMLKSFKEFITSSAKDILIAHDAEQNDNLESSLQGTYEYEDRLYLFVRRAHDEDLLLCSNRIVHGYKPDWIILDFSSNANQVNLCAKDSNHGLQIADHLVSRYFEGEHSFMNVQDYNFAAQIKKFLQIVINESDEQIKLFELKFKSSNFKNNTHLVITTSFTDSIAEELQVLKQSTGDILADISLIEQVRIVFRRKKVSLIFKNHPHDSDHIMVCYSEHVLDKNTRKAFKSWMKDNYGLTILSKARCARSNPRIASE